MALVEEHARLSLPAPRRRPGIAIDLYTDAVSRHAGTNRVALRWYDRRFGFRDLSFAELDQRAGAWASAWARQGVVPGATLAVLLPLGPEYLIALAAALRLIAGGHDPRLPGEDRVLSPLFFTAPAALSWSRTAPPS